MSKYFDIYGIDEQKGPWSELVDVQADLDLHCSHVSLVILL